MELQPIFNEQIFKLAKEMDEAHLKHAQFQALLNGIEMETNLKVFPPDEPSTEKNELEEQCSLPWQEIKYQTQLIMTITPTWKKNEIIITTFITLKIMKRREFIFSE